MIKITIKQLLEAVGNKENQPLKKLAGLDLPFRISWEFSETVLDAQEQHGRVMDLAKKLFEKYAEKKEGTEELVVQGDNFKLYLDESKVMEDTIVELAGCLVPKSLILKKEKNELSAIDVIALKPFIDATA